MSLSHTNTFYPVNTIITSILDEGTDVQGISVIPKVTQLTNGRVKI